MPGYAEIEIVVSEVSFPWRLSLCKKIQDVERLLSKILMVKESCNLIYTSTPITCQTKHFKIRSSNYGQTQIHRTLPVTAGGPTNVFRLAQQIAQYKYI